MRSTHDCRFCGAAGAASHRARVFSSSIWCAASRRTTTAARADLPSPPKRAGAPVSTHSAHAGSALRLCATTCSRWLSLHHPPRRRRAPRQSMAARRPPARAMRRLCWGCLPPPSARRRRPRRHPARPPASANPESPKRRRPSKPQGIVRSPTKLCWHVQGLGHRSRSRSRGRSRGRLR